MQDGHEVKLVDDIDQLIKGAIRRIPLINKIDTRSLACRITRVSQAYVEAKLNEKQLPSKDESAQPEVEERKLDGLVS